MPPHIFESLENEPNPPALNNNECPKKKRIGRGKEEAIKRRVVVQNNSIPKVVDFCVYSQ
jgi:hypothetical protein